MPFDSGFCKHLKFWHHKPINLSLYDSCLVLFKDTFPIPKSYKLLEENTRLNLKFAFLTFSSLIRGEFIFGYDSK